MAPNITTSSLIDADPLENPFKNDPGNQIITTFYNSEMINEFLDLYSRGRLNGGNCEELQEFEKQVSEFEQKYKISFSLLAKVKQAVSCRSAGNRFPEVNPYVFLDLVDMIRQAELIREMESWGNQNYNNIVVDVPVVTHVQASVTLSRQHQQNETQNNGGPCQAPESMKLGKTFFPLTVQAGLTVLTSFSAAAEAKQLLHIAAVSNMMGYIGCLAEILLRHHDNCRAAKIMGRIGATAAVFGFLTMMGTLIRVNPVEMIGIASLVTLIFFVSVIKL